MTSIKKTLRAARVLHVALLVMVLVDFDVSYRLAPIQNQISPIMVYAITFVCLNDIGVAVFLRSRMIGPSVESLLSNPSDESALKKWRTGVFVSLVMASTIVLFGLVLKFMGATWNVAGWFFIAGILLLLIWTPRLDVSPVD
jgi:F0F1-type ATP synthase membrane subunit c/vacuolar-type H+-ATPase subunit K